MFTTEVRVNGTLVVFIYGHNEGSYLPGLSRYKYELYQPETERVQTGEVAHKRSDGILRLVQKILLHVEAKE